MPGIQCKNNGNEYGKRYVINQQQLIILKG